MEKKRILITGAAGMVGKNLCEHANGKAYTLLTPTRAELDLSNRPAIDEYIALNRPDLVIHCAGVVGGIQANIVEPVRFLTENLNMGVNLVLSAKRSGIKNLVNLGSSCMYSRNEPNPLREESILNGILEPTNEGYALAKITVARLCEYVNREDQSFHYKTLIPCNIYGRYDNFDPERSHLVPAVIQKLHQAKVENKSEVTIWGDGLARREFMYAGDFADCLWRVISHFDSVPEYMNVGIGRDWSIKEYYEQAALVVGFKGRFKHDLGKPVGMKKKLVDTNRIRKWGWQPKSTLFQGLEATYKYFLEKVC